MSLYDYINAQNIQLLVIQKISKKYLKFMKTPLTIEDSTTIFTF